MVRILLAVKHHLLRATLHEYLLLPGEFVCGEAATSEELWTQLLHHEWNVLILDICLPQQTKLQTVRMLHGLYPELPIVAISFSADIPNKHWQDAGASGFVSKAKLSTELIEAVRIISQGGNYFTNGGAEERIL